MANPVSGKSVDWQLGFQSPSSPVMEGIVNTHSLLMWICSGILLAVLVLLGYVLWKYRASKNATPSKVTHNLTLEIIWTVIPVIILIFIGIPSIKLLRFMDTPVNTDMTIKAIGKQWYWTYEYPNPEKPGEVLEFDSYMIPDHELKAGQLRLLDVDNPVVVPINTTIKILVTGADVLHSFAVPSLGIKRDAVPGRVNETWIRISKPGMYYGQCSEICGAKHGFMPIAIKAVSKEDYQNWFTAKTAPIPEAATTPTQQAVAKVSGKSPTTTPATTEIVSTTLSNKVVENTATIQQTMDTKTKEQA